jgi:TonB dependent receptor-like, beta-barrel/CarboxypepD_reg-like domain/TonB-dependent Receptor Plug Domain
LLNRVLTASFLILGLLSLGEADGQTLKFRFDSTPLQTALTHFTTVTNVDVVFGRSVVEGKHTSCHFDGTDPALALKCIIAGTGVSMRRVDDEQYVLVPPADAPLRASTQDSKTLSGFIRDADSGEYLFGANLYLPDLGIGTTTNSVGYFVFPGIPAGDHRTLISFIGFQTQDTLLVSSKKQHSVALQPVTISVDGLVIEQPALRRTDLMAVPGLVSIPVQRLEELPSSFGGKDVFEVFRLLPGIQRTGEATGGLLVRGSGPDQNLYLIDGAPIYHPWHAFSLISTFQTEAFKDIKLYRGGFPAEFGGRLSAVLDAELRDGSRTEPRMVASINALNARFLIESPIGPTSSFMLSGRRSYIDKIIGRSHPVSDDSGRRDTLRTGYFFYDWNGKISFSPSEKSRFSFSYYSGRDVLDLKLPFDLSLDFASWLRPADLFFEVDQSWGNTLYSLRYQYLATDRFFLTGTAYSSVYSAREATLIRPSRTATVDSDYDVLLSDVGIRVDADFFASLAHQIRSGFMLVNHRFRSGIQALVTYAPGLNENLSGTGDIQAIEYAGYVQDHWKLNSRMTVLAGLRASYFESGNYFRLSPRLNFQYVAHPDLLVLKAAATSQVQYLQRIRDRFSFLYDLVSSRWIPSDSSVVPSRGVQFSVGAESHPSSWVKLNLDAFLRKSDGVLLPRDEFQTKNGLLGPGIEIGTLLGQYSRGEERSIGVELGAEFAFRTWNLLMSYTGSRSESRTPDLVDSGYRPTRFDSPRSTALVVQRSTGNWKSSISVVWRSGYPVSVPEARYSLSDPITGERTSYFYRPAINNGRLPPYFRVDASLGYGFSFLDAAWSAKIHIYNLTGRRNVVGRSFDPSEEGFNPKDRLGLPLLPLFEIEMSL